MKIGILKMKQSKDLSSDTRTKNIDSWRFSRKKDTKRAFRDAIAGLNLSEIYDSAERNGKQYGSLE